MKRNLYTRDALGIYLHIPFCRSKCGYCDFYSRPGCEALFDRYVAALTAQICETFPEGGSYCADTVYFGGGTPSVLGGKRLAALLKALSRRVLLTQSAEITVEVNPESVDKGLLRTLRHAGVNRLSMGVQSSDDGELAMLGRIHDFGRARGAVALIRAAGFHNLSLDLMYGLPGQTAARWRQSVEDVLALAPEHLSCYGLRLEEGTPLYARRGEQPDDDTQAEMYLWAVERLAQAGYAQYEISNFARAGFRAKHNSKYWDLSPYVGLGCAAHSFCNGRRSKVVSDVQKYLDAYEGKGGQVLEDADDCSYIDRVGEYVMLGLRTCDGVSETAFDRQFRRDFSPFAERLRTYIAGGFVTFDGDRWRLTPKGFLVSNVIIGAALDGACGEGEIVRG